MSEHRPGVDENTLMTTHQIKLVGLNNSNEKLIKTEISSMISIDNVWIDSENGTIKIAYDGKRQSIEKIFDVIRLHGADICHNWWNEFKFNWDKETDHVIKENAKYEPHLCNKIPADFKPLK